MRASSQCSLIRLFSIRTTSKWFHLYSRLGSSGSLAVRSHIMNEYGPLISVSDRRIHPLRLDFARRAAGDTAHELFEAVAALGNVGVVLDVARIHGLVGQLQVAVLEHVLQLLGGHRQGLLFFLRQLARVPLHRRLRRDSGLHGARCRRIFCALSQCS